MKDYISVENISFKYSHHQSDYVLENISFKVRKGDIFYLLGPNGTGKSTLLKCLAGLLKVQQGHTYLEGTDIGSISHNTIAKKLAFVPQSHSSAFPYSVRDIVVMGRSPHINIMSSPSENDFKQTDNALEIAGITNLAERACTELSGGEWQLVLIARALAQDPEILLLDEPTSHLDLGNQIKILHVIENLAARNLTIIIATHFPDHALIHSNQAAILKQKHIMSIGPTEEVITEENMHKAYGVNVKITHIYDGVDRKICVPVLT